MASQAPIILILGAGANIGQSTARHFAAKGYRVALAARSVKEADSNKDLLNVPTDLTKPDDVVKTFAKVRETFGIPSVVLYNASAATFTPAEEQFVPSLAELSRDNNINVYSAYVAAQQAVQGFVELPNSAARTFLYTGNVLNVKMLPQFMTAGIGKSGAAYMVWTAAVAYANRGYKFYYVDERKADGAPKYRVDGDAHAELFGELAEAEGQGPWMQTFVKGTGYRDFGAQYNASL